MADHMWFVPVTGGHEHGLEFSMRPGITGIDNTSVQWDAAKYPSGEETEAACTSMTSLTALAMGAVGPPIVESKLTDCFGTWRWRSCTDGSNITVGGQLGVGTVFSRWLNRYIDNPLPPPPIIADPAGNLSWNRVDAWVKFRLNAANINMFDNVFFVINDSAGLSAGLNAAPRNWIGTVGLAVGSWFVAHAFVSQTPQEWDDWEYENLRATLSVQGTSVPANVGPVEVNVEWFAFRLSEQQL
jgi:hypothetical protein